MGVGQILCNVNSSKNNDLFRDVLRLFAHLSQVQKKKTHQIQELMFYAFRYYASKESHFQMISILLYIGFCRWKLVEALSLPRCL